MNAIRLRYAMDVVLYLRGDINATDEMIEHICERFIDEIPYTTLNGDESTVDEWMADRTLTAEDLGLTIEQVHEAEDELVRLDAMERDDDPGNVGYIARKAAMESR